MPTQQLPSTASDDTDIKFAYIKNKEVEIWLSPDQKSTIVMPNISPNMMTQKELETYKIIESGRGFEKGVVEEPEQNVEEMSREKYDKALHVNKELGKANFALREELRSLRVDNKKLRLYVKTIKNQHDEDWRAKNEWMDERDKKQKEKIRKLEEKIEKLKEQPKEADQDLPVAASSSTDSSARSTPAHLIPPTPISFSPEIEEYLRKHGGNIQFCKSFVALLCQEVRAVPMPSELFNAFKGKRKDIRYDEEAQGVFHRFRATLKDEQNKQLATGQVTLKEKKTRTKRIASSGGIGEPSQKEPKFDRDESEDDKEAEELLDDM
ncbi:hypothetical protein CRE_06532 [Caenorhabditis remanei]|uniref:Uncharacterized protein n=1 Tax=Caenorhabditis remanei TaxID=31234 RepID=E3M1F5_CAERE|nr:hypothetical protein CRE_06532 [Caenorhabditis remanei]